MLELEPGMAQEQGVDCWWALSISFLYCLLSGCVIIKACPSTVGVLPWQGGPKWARMFNWCVCVALFGQTAKFTIGGNIPANPKMSNTQDIDLWYSKSLTCSNHSLLLSVVLLWHARYFPLAVMWWLRLFSWSCGDDIQPLWWRADSSEGKV